MSKAAADQSATPSTFEKSLKPIAIEEFLDFYFYRRVAHLMVPLLIKLRLSPNQVTTLSLISGLFSAWFVLNQHFVLGGLLALTAVFLDCCDGQVARLTGKTSPFGRIMDGAFDAIWISALWLAIYLSGYFQESFSFLFWLMLVSSLSTFLHCFRFDAIKLRYLELANPDSSENVKDIDSAASIRLMKEKLKKFHLIEAFLAFMNALQNFLSGRHISEKGNYDIAPATRLKIREELEPIIKRWTWLGEGHHSTLIILGLFMAPYYPAVLLASFCIIFIPMNLWHAYCEWSWIRAMRKVRPLLNNQNNTNSPTIERTDRNY